MQDSSFLEIADSAKLIGIGATKMTRNQIKKENQREIWWTQKPKTTLVYFIFIKATKEMRLKQKIMITIDLI